MEAVTWGGRKVASKRERVVAVYGSVCVHCGMSIPLQLRYPHPLSFSIEHLIPRAHGGSDHMENLRPSHLRCNLSRGTKPIGGPRITTTPEPRLRRPPESGAAFFR